MIELIFAIVILGIVASIGSEIIANVFKNYVLQRATHRANIKTELAAQQIANLLTHRIPGTTIARKPSDWGDSVYIYDPTVASDEKHTAIEWIGEDFESFSATKVPGWSGFCDVNASSQSTLKTPGSNLNTGFAIMQKLGMSGSNPAIFFRHSLYSKEGGADVYYRALAEGSHPGCLGLISNDRSCISSVSKSGQDTLQFQHQGSSSKKIISEHYKLAWTAYAIVPFKPKSNTVCAEGESPCDLKLAYNYQPWEGERLDNSLGSISTSTIITNVTVFKFAESGNTLRFKLCVQENIGESHNITSCKEKAIIR